MPLPTPRHTPGSTVDDDLSAPEGKGRQSPAPEKRHEEFTVTPAPVPDTSEALDECSDAVKPYEQVRRASLGVDKVVWSGGGRGYVRTALQ